MTLSEALQIRKSTFRNQPGFSIVGREGGAFGTKIFVKRRETAEAIRDAIKRGATSQEIDKLILREHVQHGKGNLNNIDAMVEQVANGADPDLVLQESRQRPKQEVRGLDERDLLDEIVLVAENDGRAFAAGKDARLAVTNAISDLEKEFKSTLRRIEPKAIQMVTASWRDA